VRHPLAFAESCQGLLPGDLFAGFGFSLDTAGLTNEKTCAYVDDADVTTKRGLYREMRNQITTALLNLTGN
jgi:hypothetical protein